MAACWPWPKARPCQKAARRAIRLLADPFHDTHQRILEISAPLRTEAEADDLTKRLQTVPGVGRVIASALAASVPDVSNFGAAHDLAAWIDLTPKPHSRGGKEKLGKITKMGNRYLRRLLYPGAMAQVTQRARKPAGEDRLRNVLQRKPLKLVAIALAARIDRTIWARTIWALIKRGESYRDQTA